MRPSRRRARRVAALREELLVAEEAWAKALSRWQHVPTLVEARRIAREYGEAIDAIDHPDAALAARLGALEPRRHGILQTRHLERFAIADARLAGITRSTVRALAAYGFATAADVVHLERTKVPGVGKVRTETLRDWAEKLRREYRPDPNAPLPPDVVAAARVDHDRSQREALARLPVFRIEIEKRLGAARFTHGTMVASMTQLAENVTRLRRALAALGEGP